MCRFSHFFLSVSVTNPCDKKKCEWLCLLSPSGPVCTCPNNYVADNGTCVERTSPTQSPFCKSTHINVYYTHSHSCTFTPETLALDAALKTTFLLCSSPLRAVQHSVSERRQLLPQCPSGGQMSLSAQLHWGAM